MHRLLATLCCSSLALALALAGVSANARAGAPSSAPANAPSNAPADGKPPPCATLQKHLNKAASLRTFMVKEGEAVDGRRSIDNIDVDADGEPERVVVSRPSASDNRFPPSPSAISIVLSGSKTELRTEFHRLYLIRFEGIVYLVGSRLVDPQGPVLTDVQRVDKSGFVPACRYECNLRGGCRPRSDENGKR